MYTIEEIIQGLSNDVQTNNGFVIRMRKHLKIDNPRRIPVIDKFILYDEISDLHTYYHIDIENFVTQFNNTFNYVMEDDINEINEEEKDYLLRYFNIRLEHIKLEDIDTLRRIQLFTEYTLDIIVWNILISKQLGIENNYFRYPRKLSPYDFNWVCIKNATIETLQTAFSYVTTDTYIMSLDLLHKIERSFQIQYITKEFEISSPPKDHLFLSFFKHTSILISNPVFNREVYKFLKQVIDELELINWIGELNEEYLESSSSILEISKIPELSKFSKHQKCLLLQLLIGNIYQFSQFSLSFKDEIQQIIDILIKDTDCSQYLNYRTKTIHCSHVTFHYYSFVHWVSIFHRLLESTGQKEIKHRNQITGDILVPQRSFCDWCYNEYKYHETIKSDDKFIAILQNERLKIYRSKYKDLCDIESTNHYLQINELEKANKKIISKWLNELKREIRYFKQEIQYFNK
jgi:hypothetical protein